MSQRFVGSRGVPVIDRANPISPVMARRWSRKTNILADAILARRDPTQPLQSSSASAAGSCIPSTLRRWSYEFGVKASIVNARRRNFKPPWEG